MGEFSAQWLSLREPIDHAARSSRVTQAMLSDLQARHGESVALKVVDLGCGSGSNLRAIAPLLGQEQHWTLVDYDQALLAAARTALRAWADEVVADEPETLRISKAHALIDVSFRVADLSREIESVLALPADLVTASALFDLVSRNWVDRFCDSLRAPLYAVLSFDGQMSWTPSHQHDATVNAAFSEHQATDKGFGPALGPKSGAYLSNALQQRGFNVLADKSPWDIEDLPSAFHDMLIEGIAQAVNETGRLSRAELDAWLAHNRTATRCVVGHDDIYATKPVLR